MPEHPESNPPIQSYRDLLVWQQAMHFVEGVYVATRTFPSEERLGLTLQLRRASVSVPSNIAEGWGRGQRKEYAHFVRIARGSLCESETQLMLAQKLGFLDQGVATALISEAYSVSRMLLNLLRALSR
jgi:four helix bundle protein